MEKKGKTMRLLMVVGCANDIFVYYLTRWLKASMPVEIDLFEFWPSRQQNYSTDAVGCVGSGSNASWLCRSPFASFTGAFVWRRQLLRFLKGRHYDVIHFHWISAPVVLVKGLHAYAERVFATFWGGELEQQRLLRSHRRYLSRLHCFMRQVDAVVNSGSFRDKFQTAFPEYAGRYFIGEFGSAVMEEIYRLTDAGETALARQKWHVPEGKVSVMVGYSGKELHQHLQVIEAFRRHPEWQGRFHLLAPMTRSADPVYVTQVEEALRASGYSHTLVRDRFLTEPEMAALRVATDVVFQASRFDGFSRSIIECLCAGSLLVYGNWLPYQGYLEEYGFFALPMESVEEGVCLAAAASERAGAYAKELDANATHGRGRFVWSACVENWVAAYQSETK
ncbi:MAG: hypothetical protein J5873_04320 [Bacteroidales bacterium]|nr:hypothetical protein [Bacteroidales bacterium]